MSLTKLVETRGSSLCLAFANHSLEIFIQRASGKALLCHLPLQNQSILQYFLREAKLNQNFYVIEDTGGVFATTSPRKLRIAQSSFCKALYMAAKSLP